MSRRRTSALPLKRLRRTVEIIDSMAIVHDSDWASQSGAPSRRMVNVSSSPSRTDAVAKECSGSSWVARPLATLRPRVQSGALKAPAS